MTSIDQLKDKYNTGTVKKIGEFRDDKPVLSTGIYPLDLAIGAVDKDLGTPGLTLGDVMEVAGYNNSFKTGTWEQMAKATLDRYGPQSVVGLFTEPPSAERIYGLGIIPDDIISIDCYHEEASRADVLAERGLEAILEFAKIPQVKLCIIDSIGNLATTNELYKERGKPRSLGERVVATNANVFNQFCKEYSSIEGHRAALVLINFYREQINTGFGFKLPTNSLTVETGGGRGKEFLSHVRLICTSNPVFRETNHSVLDNKVETGREITYKIFKNKNSKNYGSVSVKAKFDFRTKKINNSETLLNWATFFQYKEGPDTKSILNPPVTRAGAWVRVGDEKFQGFDRAGAYLDTRPDLQKEILAQLARPEYRNQFFEDDKRFKSEAILDEASD